MSNVRFSKREKILGGVTAACVLTVLLAQVCFDRVHRHLEETGQQALRLEESLRKAQVLLSREALVEDDFRRAVDALGEKEGDQEHLTQMLATINTTAQTKNIQLQELNSLPSETDNGVTTIKIKLLFTGSWPSVLELFNELQKAPQRFDLDEVVLEKLPSADHAVRGQMTLTRWSLAAAAL